MFTNGRRSRHGIWTYIGSWTAALAEYLQNSLQEESRFHKCTPVMSVCSSTGLQVVFPRCTGRLQRVLPLCPTTNIQVHPSQPRAATRQYQLLSRHPLYEPSLKRWATGGKQLGPHVDPLLVATSSSTKKENFERLRRECADHARQARCPIQELATAKTN